MQIIGAMQPRFFPYIGFYQLIHAVDVFVILDETQFVKKEWMNRNRILNAKGDGWDYINLPVKKFKSGALTNHIEISDRDWRTPILNKLKNNYRRAPYFKEVYGFLEKVLASMKENNLARFNAEVTKKVCDFLGIEYCIFLSSDSGIPFPENPEKDDWALAITKKFGGTSYINPIYGSFMFDKKKYEAENIQIQFLDCEIQPYAQKGAPFQERLSIIDVMMFNSLQSIQDMLKNYSLK